MAHAEPAEAEQTVEIRPFAHTNWTGFESDFTNVFDMPFFWSDASKLKQGIVYVSWNTSDIPTMAQNLKEKFDAYPDGARFINFCLVHDAMHASIEDVVFMDKAVPIVNGWLEQFLSEYKRIGGKIDGLFLVVEYMDIYASYIHGNHAKSDPLVYKKIVDNPIYQEKIRPKLVERGFKFYDKITDTTPEIYSIHPNSGSQYATSRNIWDTVMRSYQGQIVTDCCAPLWKYYPDAVVSDYQSKDVKPWFKEISDAGGVMGGGGIQTTAGNASQDNFSFNRPAGSFFLDKNNSFDFPNIPAFNNTIFADTEFNRFLFDANIAKNMYLSSDTGNLTYWIVPVYWSENVYYVETLIHMGMVNPKAYHGYILKQDCGNSQEKYEQALQVVDDCLRELTRLVGAADRKPIVYDVSWNHGFVLSGMHAGGKNVWRITPDTTNITKEDFLVEGTDPTFSIGGETVTFPGGKIVEDEKITLVGSCGYWVETAENVYPIITREEDFFRKYPAYMEDYEAYAAGTEYNYNNAKPLSAWEPKKSGSSTATVVADPVNAENQVMAVKGTYSFKNVKLLKNVTAGDVYAKNQAWEISFTLPSDMAADAELVLLNYTDAKEKVKDAGVKIAGGKVYYTQGKDYVEMAGVTLSAGTKYSVIRDMDFTNPNAFTCDYYVYAGETLLGKAMDIAVEPITLPVGSISFSCKNVAGEPVLFDDYKLYATQVTTDLYLYESTFGMKIEDQTQAQESGVAFRLSWLNGTKTEKTYSVMAAYYNGDTLVEEKVFTEVKMAPGADGVVTGVVDNATEGQRLLVYLRDNNPPEVDEGTEEIVTPPEAPKKGLNREIKLGSLAVKLWVILVVIAGVLVLGAGVVILIAAKKKKNTPPAE